MANVARVIVRFGLVDNTLTSNLLLHVKAVDSHAAIDADDRLALAEATIDWWTSDGADYGAVASAYPGDIALQEIVVTTVEPALSADTIVPGENFAGTYQNVPATTTRMLLPPQCAFLVGLRTLEDSRRGRGRMYLPAFFTITTNPVDPTGTIIAPRAEEIALGYNGGFDFLDDLAHMASRIAEAYYWTPGADEAEFVQCVYSKVDGVGRAVTHFDIAQHIRTQRRRALHPSPHSRYGLDGSPA